MKNYYEELEVNPNASKEIIEKVYKVLAKKYHPDMNSDGDKTAAEEKFKRVSEAYEVLSDDRKRQEYDLQLQNSEKTIPYDEYMKIIAEKEAITNQLQNLQDAVNQYNAQFQNNYNYGYAYSNRRQPSSFEVFKYKVKKKFENLILIVLVIAVLILMINAFTHGSLLNFLIAS